MAITPTALPTVSANQAGAIANINTAWDAVDELTAIFNGWVSTDRGVKAGALVFNIEDSGAVTGTDSSVAIRSVLASAPVGAVVYIPDGTFTVSQDGSNFWCLDVPAGRTLAGPGTLKMANSQAPSVRIFRVAADNVTISGLTLDMNRANQSVEGNPQRHAIYCTGDGLRVVNCTITGPTGDAILFDSGSENVLVQGNRFTDCERNGVTFYGNSAGVRVVNNIRVIGNHIEADVQAVDSEPTNGHVDNVHVHGNYLQSTGNNYAVTCAAALGEFNQGWSIIGNTLVGALYVTCLGASTIAGNTIDATATALRAVAGQYNSLNVSFSDNKVYAATDQYCMSLQIVGANRPVGWMIKGNTFNVLGTAGEGIHMTGTGPITVTDNHFYGVNSAYGIYNQATANMESVGIHHNYFDGFATAVYAAPFSTFTFNKLSITNNQISNTQGTPTANYGVRLAGTVAQFTQTVVTGNIVDAVYTTPEDMSTVIVRISGTDRLGHWSCTGTPESQVTARIGSTCSRRDGGTNTTLYVKESGTGNTGWRAQVSVLPAQIDVFTANGTWTKPAGATTVHVVALAGGAGGGSGRRGAAASVRCGGGGGGGGGITLRTIPAASCGATEAVTVGAGGAGGAAVTADDTNGATGTAGANSTFGTHVKAWAPAAGGGGTNGAGTAGGAGSGAFNGGAGAAASATGGVGAAAATSPNGPSGGGGGGGVTSGDSPSAGGTGGLVSSVSRATSTGAAINTAATSSPDAPTSSAEPGQGGGGGGGSIVGAAGAGANGAIYGAAGGGGGASLNGNNSGKGGDGAAGLVLVVTTF